VSFAAITLCVASQRVFIVVSVYFVIDSVRKLLGTHSYKETSTPTCPALLRELYLNGNFSFTRGNPMLCLQLHNILDSHVSVYGENEQI
jgi:hypothetical protein